MQKKTPLRDFFDFRVIVGILTFASLSSIHYVSFVYGLPPDFRRILDIQFQAGMIGEFTLVTVFSLSVSRFLPPVILGFLANAISLVISFKYVWRGYDRVPTPFGIFKKGRVISLKKQQEFTARLNRFGRKSARFDNFVTDKVQAVLPLVWYETNRYTVTVFLSILLFLTIFLGLSSAVWLASLATVLYGAFLTYFGSNDKFRFRIIGRLYEADQEDFKPAATNFGPHDFLLVALTLAILTAVAGPLRLNSIIKNGEIKILSGEIAIVGAVIGSTASGIIVYDDRFRYLSYDGLLLEEP